MEQHLNIIPFDLSNRQFQFRPHYEKDIYVMTGTVSPNGKLIAYAVYTKDNSEFHEKYVILNDGHPNSVANETIAKYLYLQLLKK